MQHLDATCADALRQRLDLCLMLHGPARFGPCASALRNARLRRLRRMRDAVESIVADHMRRRTFRPDLAPCDRRAA